MLKQEGGLEVDQPGRVRRVWGFDVGGNCLWAKGYENENENDLQHVPMTR
jgi:hypothetical protein